MDLTGPIADPDPSPPPPPGAQFHRRLPPLGLRHLVMRYTGYVESSAAEVRQVETASLVVPIIISFAERFRIALGREPDDGDAVPSFVAGLYAGPVFVRSAGRAACLQIDFTPLGAWKFLQMPLRALTARMVAVDAVGRRGLRTLAQRVEDEPDWQRRLTIAEAFVSRRLADAPEMPPALAHAYHRLVGTPGGVRVEEVASEIGWSRKHLAQRFEQEIGLTPKAVAGIARFASARRRALAEPRADWAEIAVASGYSDQAHLIRDFRRYADETPARWLAGAR